MNDILVDDDNVIFAGHARVEAARSLGLKEVPYRRLSGMSAADIREYAIADNQLALKAGYDTAILAAELKFLTTTGIDIDCTGFEISEADIIIDEAEQASPAKRDPTDERAVGLPKITVSRAGDLWVLGNHRLLCGDSKDPDAIERLMAGERARMTFADVPFNVRIVGNVRGAGKTEHREFAEASGEMCRTDYTAFLTTSFERIESVSVNGAIIFVCMDWRHLREILDAGHAVFSELKNLCVWDKNNAGMGTFYRSKHELIFVWKVGDAEHVNTFGLGDTGRYRTNVWPYRQRTPRAVRRAS